MEPVRRTINNFMPTPIQSMSTEQRRLVCNSFDLARDLSRPFALLFYGKLFEMDPSARALFHNDLTLQGQKLMDMLSAIVESLDDFDFMRSKLAELGRKHASYGVRLEQYGTLVTALLWTLGQALGGDFDAPTREAWKAALAAVGEAMTVDQVRPVSDTQR